MNTGVRFSGFTHYGPFDRYLKDDSGNIGSISTDSVISYSKGEKQILAISILWGLSIVSGRDIPVIIDTPLSRLDSEHRKNIVEEYYFRMMSKQHQGSQNTEEKLLSIQLYYILFLQFLVLF